MQDVHVTQALARLGQFASRSRAALALPRARTTSRSAPRAPRRKTCGGSCRQLCALPGSPPPSALAPHSTRRRGVARLVAMATAPLRQRPAAGSQLAVRCYGPRYWQAFYVPRRLAARLVKSGRCNGVIGARKCAREAPLSPRRTIHLQRKSSSCPAPLTT